MKHILLSLALLLGSSAACLSHMPTVDAVVRHVVQEELQSTTGAGTYPDTTNGSLPPEPLSPAVHPAPVVPLWDSGQIDVTTDGQSTFDVPASAFEGIEGDPVVVIDWDLGHHGGGHGLLTWGVMRQSSFGGKDSVLDIWTNHRASTLAIRAGNTRSGRGMSGASGGKFRNQSTDHDHFFEARGWKLPSGRHTFAFRYSQQQNRWKFFIREHGSSEAPQVAHIQMGYDQKIKARTLYLGHHANRSDHPDGVPLRIYRVTVHDVR